jgi:serine/threonine-protein kinase
MGLGGGDRFAGYIIVQLLGSGGMGDVYLAKHPRLPRQEALKILHPSVSDDDTFRQRFIREADTVAALEHPNIVTVYDRGDSEGQLWIATRYVEGCDAAQLLRDRYPAGMPTELVAEILTAVAAALDYAHGKGLLHRDVKPANILLAHPDHDGNRRIYLADFGIARPLDDPAGLTATNFTLGTFAYTAPEQLLGEQIDGRADQYALAATAYQLLTGKTLFPHTNPAVVISNHLHTPPPSLAATRPERAALEPVLSAALAKNPNSRFTSCAAFAAAFAEQSCHSPNVAPMAPTAQAPTPPPPSPPPIRTSPTPPTAATPRPRRRIAATLVVLTGAITAAGLWWVSRTTNDQPAATPTPASATSPTPTAAVTTPRTPPTTPTTPSPATRPIVQAPPLDGTYRFEREGTDADWVAFRDLCTANGCIATNAFLNPMNLNAPDKEPRAWVWHWTGALWETSSTRTLECTGFAGRSSETRAATQSLTVAGDGNYILTSKSVVITNECGNEGANYSSTATLTRTGPAPVGVVADPPVSLIGQKPAPLPSPTQRPSRTVTVTVDGRPFVSGAPTCIWSDNRTLDVLVKGPNGKVVTVVRELSVAGASWADITIDGTMFTDTEGRTVSVTQMGVTAYRVTGVVRDVLTGRSKTFEMNVMC